MRTHVSSTPFVAFAISDPSSSWMVAAPTKQKRLPRVLAHYFSHDLHQAFPNQKHSKILTSSRSILTRRGYTGAMLTILHRGPSRKNLSSLPNNPCIKKRWYPCIRIFGGKHLTPHRYRNSPQPSTVTTWIFPTIIFIIWGVLLAPHLKFSPFLLDKNMRYAILVPTQ